jgi:superoxide dismutase, Fe-Mn family
MQPFPPSTEADVFVETLEPGLSRRDFLKLAGTGLGAMLLGGQSLVPMVASAAPIPRQATESGLTLSQDNRLAKAVARDYRTSLGKGFPGLSAKQVEAHIKLYEGYVNKYASISKELKTMSGAAMEAVNATYHPYRELLVEQSFALNGALLHEYYFENLSTTPQAMSAPLSQGFTSAFGSTEAFKTKLMAAAKAMRGWAILGYCVWDDALHLYGLDMHHMYSPMGVSPILVMDVYEHAYMIDYGTDRGAYLDAVWPYIHWANVEQRLNRAKGQTAPA